MSDDLVKRLRDECEDANDPIFMTRATLLKVADRIEKLEAALLVALGMLSEMGLAPAEKCELAYEHLLKTGARNER